MRRRAVLLGALACGAAAAAPDRQVDTSGRQCVVTVLLNGRPARLLLDTGAERSLLTLAAMRRLDLPPDPWVGATVRGSGGLVEHRANADIRSATLGGVHLFQRAPGSGLSLPVTRSYLGGLDGLLGGDVLRHHVLYVDLPRSRLLLFPAASAPSGLDAADQVPLALLRTDLLLAPLRIDGRDLTGLIDTGASASLVNARGLHRLGRAGAPDDPDGRALDDDSTAETVGGKLATRRQRFGMLCLGSLCLQDQLFASAAVPEPAFDITLGLDVLARRPFLLSYAALKLSLLAG